MADRESVFSHPVVQKLLREKFVPLAMNDWYLRRQEDADGRFFRAMTEASPRGDAGTDTRQGRYVFTAAGKFLGYNNNRSVERILAMLEDSLTKWESLPAAEKFPQSEVAAGVPDPKFSPAPPEGGAVVKVYTRVLENGPDGSLAVCQTAAEDGPSGTAAAVDHLWLRKLDVQALIALTSGETGAAREIPTEIAQRLARFHLRDNTRGEPPEWKKEEVRELRFSLTPESADKAALSGSVHLETTDGKRGFTGTLTGSLECREGKLTLLRAAVVGEHWGEATYTRGARPGKSPLGFAIVLCPEPQPADLIPPQAATWLDGYYEPRRRD